jgi:hypothetical protein
MIMQSGDVAASRARMIARTEIGRATGALTQARAFRLVLRGTGGVLKVQAPGHHTEK